MGDGIGFYDYSFIAFCRVDRRYRFCNILVDRTFSSKNGEIHFSFSAKATGGRRIDTVCILSNIYSKIKSDYQERTLLLLRGTCQSNKIEDNKSSGISMDG